MGEDEQEIEEMNEDISLEEAKFVISSQLVVYQHIRDQTLRLFRVLIAAIAVAVTGLSIITPINFGFVPSLEAIISKSTEYYSMSRITVEILLAPQPMIVLFCFSLMGTGLLTCILQMRNILTGPGLKPNIGAEVNPRFLDVIRPIEDQNWSDWRGDSNRYKDWISHNSRCLDVLRRREHQMYSDLTLFTLGAIGLVGTAAFYLNGTIVALSILEFFGFLFLIVAFFARKYDDQRTRIVIFVVFSSIILIIYFLVLVFA